jgi:tripartite-type tricarboxylate transporter receptor subunit TctC
MTRTLTIALALAATITAAAAQPFPSRPVTMVVPFGAGGPTDALARIVAERMRSSLGQTVLVENVTGASGTIGVGRVARAPADGYTMVLGNWPSFVVASAIYANLSYDVGKDFEPIAQLPNNPYIVVSKKDLPAKDLKELIAYIKANPDKLSAGTGGAGSGQHVSGVYFQKVTGTSFTFVPYRAGSADVMRDLTAGHIDLSFDQAISALPFVRSGQVRAYAITGKTRLASAPDIPTVDEAGAPGVYISTWFGLWAPKGTPADAVAKLSAAALEALADPAVQKRLSDLGQEIPPADQQSAAALAAHLKAELDKWTPIIKEANIKVD